MNVGVLTLYKTAPEVLMETEKGLPDSSTEQCSLSCKRSVVLLNTLGKVALLMNTASLHAEMNTLSYLFKTLASLILSTRSNTPITMVQTPT